MTVIVIPERLKGLEWAMEGSDYLSVHAWGELADLPEEIRECWGGMGPIECIEMKVELVLAAFNDIDMDGVGAGRQLADLLVILGSNARPQFLVAYGHLISNDALRYVMVDAHSGWNLHPIMGQGPSIDVDDWTDLWRRVEFVSDGAPEPSEPLKVYRGCKSSDVYGIEWTTDIAIAYKFAGIFEGGVYQTTIDPLGVMGVIDCRGESEIVIDPDYIDHEITTLLGYPEVKR